jgi:3-oxoacyl-[acyl-carrier-protein] synthase-1
MPAAPEPAVAEPLQVIGMGARAPLGLEPRAIAAAVRAGLTRFRESPWLRRKADGEPIVASAVAAFDPALGVRDRMRELAVPAARLALAPLVASGLWRAGTPLPVLLSVPPVRPGLAAGEGAALAREIMLALPIEPDRAASGIFDGGQDGGLAALAGAAALLARDEADACLVGGVDSLVDLPLLHWLEGLGRLKGERAPSGLVPGEGAAFLLVCGERFRRMLQLPSLGAVTPPAGAVEPNPWYEARPCLGEGLTEALRAALESGLPARARADTTWCDLNGEPWRADEWSFAYLRTSDRHGEPLRLRHPADALGDLGAATGTMLVLLAALDLAHPRTVAQSALVFVASDTRPQRAACIVSRHREEKRWAS